MIINVVYQMGIAVFEFKYNPVIAGYCKFGDFLIAWFIELQRYSPQNTNSGLRHAVPPAHALIGIGYCCYQSCVFFSRTELSWGRLTLLRQ